METRGRPSNEAGQILIIGAVMLVPLLGFLGLAFDAGYLFQQKRRMQAAADSGGRGGAEELRRGSAAAVITAARADTASNGFTDSVGGVSVAVNNPPVTGPHLGDSHFLEAVITQNQPTFFMQLFGFNGIPMSARSVAGLVGSPNCVYALDPGASAALSASGSITITTNCGIDVNSTSATAINASGSVKINATNVGVTGGASISGTASITPSVITGIPPSVDPLAYLAQPAVPGTCDHINYNLSGSGAATINPGTYCGGINVSGSRTVTLNSGLYILKGGGVQLSGSSSFSGTDVSFFNTSGGGYAYAGIHFSGSTTTTLTAPTSGAMSGILFFGDRAAPAATSNAFSGSSGSKFEGTLYFPTEHLDYSGSTGLGAAYTVIVARTLTFSGSTSLTLNDNYSGLSGGSPLKEAALVE